MTRHVLQYFLKSREQKVDHLRKTQTTSSAVRYGKLRQKKHIASYVFSEVEFKRKPRASPPQASNVAPSVTACVAIAQHTRPESLADMLNIQRP